jgi:hypothetical protein
MIVRKDLRDDAPRFVIMPINGGRSDFSQRYEGLLSLLLPQCFHGWWKRKRRSGGRRVRV